jgi:hypothetical protein
MARANRPAVEVREALAKHRSNNAYLSDDSIGDLYIEEEESCDDGKTDSERVTKRTYAVSKKLTMRFS